MMQPLTSTLPAVGPPPEIELLREDCRSAWARSFTDDGPVDVSVCIANWNCKDYLRACLTSLQDCPQGVRLETIVVDNASSDGAADMVAREFPEVVLVRNAANEGFARASNQAAAQSRGRYLFFLNNDTLVPSGMLDRLVAFAESRPDAGMIGPRLRDGSGRMQISYRKRPTMWAMLHCAAILRWTGLFKFAYGAYRRKTFRPVAVQEVEVLMGAAVLMRREVFESCGRWDEDFRFGVEDVELSTRVGRTHALVFHPGVEVIHHGRLSSRQNVSFSVPNHLIGYVHYFRKSGYSTAAILGYKLLVTVDAPFQLLGRVVQYAARRLRGRRSKAGKSWLAVLGYWHFLTGGLRRFWKA